MARFHSIVSASVLLGLFVAVGCGTTEDGSTFGGDGTSGGASGDPGSSSFGGTTSSGASGTTKPCEGLACKQVDCGGGATTSLSGKVYDPSGTIPLYNAIVYVPNATLAPFTEGIACDQCGTVPSGNPITTAITNSKGEFVLKNVPVGVEIPLVVQIGRWRRQVKVPGVAQCTDTPLDAAITRLPRNKAEGEIPKIAITTGGADSLECFLRKLGIDDAEFTNPDSDVRIHLYSGVGGSKKGATPNSQTLWDDDAGLKKYDMVILSCEGNEYEAGQGGVSPKSATAKANVKDYLDKGGRVFASHFHYTWFKKGATDLQSTASWMNNADAPDQDVTVDTSFAKGVAFSEWLTEVGATPTPGQMPMTELRRNVTTVPGAGAPVDVSRRWLYATPPSGEETKFYSFNTPVGTAADKQCGRGVYTDIHVSSGDDSGGTFPGNCKTTGLTSQEKALLFLLMDLASCIQDDNKPPTAPPSGPAIK